ncbi:hypothetical protein IKI14_00835 [bacterium]|nr:hypothetical protein [bacterium]
MPLSWASELKKGNVQNKVVVQNTNISINSQKSDSDDIKVSDFPKRFSELQQNSPQSFQNAATTARNNYK